MADQSPPPGEDGTLAVLHAMLTTFTDVLDAMDRRLAAMEAAMESLRTDKEGADQLRHGLEQLRRIETIEADMADIRAALLDHPAATVQDAVARLTREVESLVAQPGPGPAMAMVAAGLSERFEQRTEGLIDMVRAHGELMEALAGHLESAVRHMVASVDARDARLDTVVASMQARDAQLETVLAAVEAGDPRLDAVLAAVEAGDPRLDAVLAAVEAGDPRLDAVLAAVAAMGSAIEQLGALPQAATREEAERIAGSVSAVSAAVDAVHELLATHVEASAHSLGRKASEAGRRLVADLGLAGRSRDAGGRPGAREDREPPAKR